MNKSVTILMLAIFCTVLKNPALAQWDLGGVPADTMSSGGQGQQAGNRDLNSDGTLRQPYNNRPSYQTIYNNQLQQGLIQNANPYSNIPIQNTGNAQFAGGSSQLAGTSMLPLSKIQATGLLNPLAYRFPKGIPLRGGLPPTTLDSFVQNAGGAASRIYGDEGTGFFGPPPQNSFTEADTINAGIAGTSNKTLTTGHGSFLPTASGNGMTKSGPH